MKYVNAPVMKKDAMALVSGKPVYMDDVAPKDCLIVKVLRSPHAHALIEEINITNALKQKGIECILTYKDVPHRRFTMAGQTFPEPSPYTLVFPSQAPWHLFSSREHLHISYPFLLVFLLLFIPVTVQVIFDRTQLALIAAAAAEISGKICLDLLLGRIVQFILHRQNVHENVN